MGVVTSARGTIRSGARMGDVSKGRRVAAAVAVAMAPRGRFLAASTTRGRGLVVEGLGEVFDEGDAVVCDFAQGRDDFFVVGFHEGLRVFHELSRTFDAEVDQREAIGNLFETVFNGNACHESPLQ